MAERIRLRCVWPDLWLETRLELPAETTVAAAKRAALEAMRLTRETESDRYYVEFRERRLADESTSLADLGVSDGAVLSIRAYDLHHPPPFRG